MAGHNKWSKIKRAKGALDIKRGKLFARLSKEISIAVKLGGSRWWRPCVQAGVVCRNDCAERGASEARGHLKTDFHLLPCAAPI